MKRKRRPLTVVYESLWETATPEQKKEYERNLNEVYFMLFDEIAEKYGKELANSRTKKRNKKSI